MNYQAYLNKLADILEDAQCPTGPYLCNVLDYVTVCPELFGPRNDHHAERLRERIRSYLPEAHLAFSRGDAPLNRYEGSPTKRRVQWLRDGAL